MVWVNLLPLKEVDSMRVMSLLPSESDSNVGLENEAVLFLLELSFEELELEANEIGVEGFDTPESSLTSVSDSCRLLTVADIDAARRLRCPMACPTLVRRRGSTMSGLRTIFPWNFVPLESCFLLQFIYLKLDLIWVAIHTRSCFAIAFITYCRKEQHSTDETRMNWVTKLLGERYYYNCCTEWRGEKWEWDHPTQKKWRKELKGWMGDKWQFVNKIIITFSGKKFMFRNLCTRKIKDINFFFLLSASKDIHCMVSKRKQ